MKPPSLIREQIERGLASKGRLRILGALAASPEVALSRYVLERRTGIRANFLASDLRALMDLGWVMERVGTGRIRRYSLNYQDKVLSKVLEFLGSVGYYS